MIESQEKRIPAAERQLPGIIFRLSLSADSLKLFAEVEALQDFVSVDMESLNGLFSDVPQKCLHHDVLRDIHDHLSPGVKLEARRIAKGIAAIDGRDAKLLLLVKPFKGDFKVSEIDRVDAKFVRAFDNIEAGFPIARIYPETLGTAGLSPLNVQLPAKPGKPIKISVDEASIERKPEQGFESLISKNVGYVSYSGDKISVVSELKVPKDVGFKTGDIEFIGSVVIGGDVGKDFEVSARGDITVQGNVSGGRILSSKGAVNIKGGVVGELLGMIQVSAASFAIDKTSFVPRDEILAKTLLSARTMEGVHAECDGDIVVEKEIRACSLSSKSAIRIPAGTLIGGWSRVICGVEASIIGTPAGTPTEIHLLSDVESSAEYADLSEKITKHRLAEDALELHLGPFAVNPNRIQKLAEPQKAKMTKLSTELRRIKNSRAELEKQLNTLLSSARFNRLLRVNVGTKLYPGVIITVGKDLFSPDSVIEGPKTIEFLPEEHRFDIRVLEPLQCELVSDEVKKQE